MCYRAVRRHAPALNIVAINTRRRLPSHVPQVGAVTAIEIDVFEVESVNMAWKIAILARSRLSKMRKTLQVSAESRELKTLHSPQNCEADIDQQVGAAAGYYEDACGGD